MALLLDSTWRSTRIYLKYGITMGDLREIVDYHHRTSTRRSTKVLGEISYLFCQNPLFNSSSIWAWPKHVSRVLLKSSTSCVNTAMLVGIVTLGVCNLRPWSSGRINLLINGWTKFASSHINVSLPVIVVQDVDRFVFRKVYFRFIRRRPAQKISILHTWGRLEHYARSRNGEWNLSAKFTPH